MLKMFGDDDINKYDDARRAAKVLDALSSPIRLLIVCKLIDGAKSVGDLVESTGTTIGNISQHLRILEMSGILESNKEGNKVFYSIKSKKIIKFIKVVKEFCRERDI